MGGGKSESAHLIVVFGAAGSLSTTKLLPAITRLSAVGGIGRRVRVIGVDVRAPSKPFNSDGSAIVRGDLNRPRTYRELGARVRSTIEGRRWDSTFYLATEPQLFSRIIEGLEAEGLNQVPGRSRIMVEKPLGSNSESFESLQRRLRGAFGRSRTYPVDHFLGKPGVMGIESARRGSPELEEALNGDCVEQVQILADEDFGVEGRGRFYDGVGVMRDMVQSHLLQVLCQLAAELPSSDSPRSQGAAKARLLRSVTPLGEDDLVWGQFLGYARTEGVAPGSRTPTFVALRLSIRSRRWRGVPFFIRTGKMMRDSLTRVAVAFRPPISIEVMGRKQRLGALTFEIDPRAGIRGGLLSGPRSRHQVAGLRELLQLSGPDEYVTLLRAAMGDDHSLFVEGRVSRSAWSIVDPPIRELEDGRTSLHAYRPGTNGPVEADRLVESMGLRWLQG